MNSFCLLGPDSIARLQDHKQCALKTKREEQNDSKESVDRKTKSHGINLEPRKKVNQKNAQKNAKRTKKKNEIRKTQKKIVHNLFLVWPMPSEKANDDKNVSRFSKWIINR